MLLNSFECSQLWPSKKGNLLKLKSTVLVTSLTISKSLTFYLREQEQYFLRFPLHWVILMKYPPTLQINHFQKVDDSWISSYPLCFWKMWDCDDSLSVTEQALRKRGLSGNIYLAWNFNRIKWVSGNRFRARRIYFLASKWETYSAISITYTHYGNK